MHIQRGAWAEINLDAVAHNVQMAKANLLPTTKLCAVVKADASCIAVNDQIMCFGSSEPFTAIYVIDQY